MGSDTSRMAQVRLTPEQVWNTLESTLGVTWQYGDYNLIVDAYGVALGGVDFNSTFERILAQGADFLGGERPVGGICDLYFSGAAQSYF